MRSISLNFDRKEFECKCGCGFATVDKELVEVLEDIRGRFQSPVTINSACRCTKHNAVVGGSLNSKHLEGIAADIVVRDIPPDQVQDYLLEKYPDRYGIGMAQNFTHLDVRNKKARWHY